MFTALTEAVEANGGFATKRQLVWLGATDRMLTAAVRYGALTRVRNGWYTTRAESDPAVRAVRVGGRLTGMSALTELGAWSWSRPRQLHVAVRRNDSRLRRPHNRRRRLRPRGDGVTVHWVASSVATSGTAWSVSVPEALVRVVLDEDLETAVIAIDWALRTGQLDRPGLEQVLDALPARARKIREWIDARSDSLLESTSRVRLKRVGLRAESQVLAAGCASPIDLLIEGQVALETDGRESHLHAFERDRRKDVALTLGGAHVIRATATMVRDHWGDVLAAVERALVERLGVAAVAERRRHVGNLGAPPPRGRRRAPCRPAIRESS